MIGPDIREVHLYVPEFVRDGLARGIYKAFGGTIRDLKGRTVALLIEGRRLAELAQGGTPLDPGTLMKAIGHADTAARMAAGLGALNVVVSIAGFAMIRQRLDQIAGQLDILTIGLRELKEEAGWVSGLQLAAIRGEIDAALDLAIRAQRQEHLQTFREAKTRAFEIRRKLHHTMKMMVDTRRALPRYEVFGELAQASAILMMAEIRCDEAVEGAGIALETLRQATREFDDVLANFRNKIRDFEGDPRTMLSLGHKGRHAIKRQRIELLNLQEQLDGMVSRITVQAGTGLSAQEWRATTAPEESNILTCVVLDVDAADKTLHR